MDAFVPSDLDYGHLQPERSSWLKAGHKTRQALREDGPFWISRNGWILDIEHELAKPSRDKD
ncbi:hypothetical protein N7539_008454 [Penicillium diatomitis]|uniref:Uncharacterized protein n=1 Tax=Penicillium diatomitis TaxID=2819901 RepID=A0A9W9WU97_9EURO|nr:uncharacterized protein N7539_008454 [Penicillium diatomitis]KAJ5475388.1 hypothetical protein N7539_008454 [Penicillium diatomitis]